MHHSPTLTRTLLLTLAFAVALAGCTRITLVYRNLDTLIPWSLNDYLAMNAEQQRGFKADLREHLSWHCKTQLPDYLNWLERLQRQVASGSVDEQTLRARYTEAREAVQVIAVEITPTTVELLRDLDDRQLKVLEDKFDEQRRERREKYLEPPLDRQIRDRADRMQERLEDWVGRLSAEQRQRVLAWSHALGDQNRRWIDNRDQWQQALVEALAQRHSPAFPERMAGLLQDREAHWTEAYRQTFERNEQAGIDLALDLYAMSSETQRARLISRLEGIRKDFSSLRCLRD